MNTSTPSGPLETQHVVAERPRPVLVALIGAVAVIIAALLGSTLHARENRAPIASLRVSLVKTDLTTAIKVDASGSHDPDGQPIEISVYEDGHRLAGREPIRVLPAPHSGDVEYRVVVTDGDLSNSEARVITVP